MNNLNKFILLILAVELFLLYLQKTSAFFSDSAHSSNNDFIASTEFPSPTPTITPTITPTLTPTPPQNIADHLVINEVYYDADSIHMLGSDTKSEWVEIYNPTGSIVDLSAWTIVDEGVSGLDTLYGSLASGGYALLIATPSADFQTKWSVPSGTLFINAGGAEIGGGLANGGDKVLLKNAGAEVDMMSWGTINTGFISGCTSVCPTVPEGNSLERSPDGFDTDAAGDFIDNSSPSPGS